MLIIARWDRVSDVIHPTSRFHADTWPQRWDLCTAGATFAAMSTTDPAPVDLLLSSGFLAFGRHIGFLEAISEAEVSVHGVYGTSSGALVGAMWAAGLSTDDILAEVTARRPIDWMTVSWTPWAGVFDLSPMVDRLRELLPPTFEALSAVGRSRLAVGVRRRSGAFAFVSSGDLPGAVAASCAIPWVFRKVTLQLGDGAEPCDDGGAVDRLGMASWRGLAPPDRRAIVHLVDRSAGAESDDNLSDVAVVRTPRSGAGFWSLGDVRARADVARERTRGVLSGGVVPTEDCPVEGGL